MGDGGPSELVESFKLLADVARLQILGHLATSPAPAEMLGERLELPASTLGKHLARLTDAGLVRRDDQGCYHFERKAWEGLVRRALAEPRRAQAELSEEEQIRVAYYTPDGRLRALPAQSGKTEAVLRPMLAAFELGERYAEPEVNERLSRYHEDVALLRRYLVDLGLLRRQVELGRVPVYWIAV